MFTLPLSPRLIAAGVALLLALGAGLYVWRLQSTLDTLRANAAVYEAAAAENNRTIDYLRRKAERDERILAEREAQLESARKTTAARKQSITELRSTDEEARNALDMRLPESVLDRLR